MLTFDQLSVKLGLSRMQLTKLVREGLPHTLRGKAKLFDPALVRQWLIEHGKAVAETPPPNNAGQRIARTRGDAAKELGISVRTFAEWMLDPTFPGKPGPPGRRDGYFPLDEIADWLAKKNGSAVVGISGESPRERLIRIRADQEQIELDRTRGQVVDVVDIERLLLRTINTTKAVLSPLPDEFLLDLPADLIPPELLGKIRELLRSRAQQRINEACETIANILEGDTDETSDEE